MIILTINNQPVVEFSLDRLGVLHILIFADIIMGDGREGIVESVSSNIGEKSEGAGSKALDFIGVLIFTP